MLAKEYRLTSTSEFKLVKEKGKVFQFPNFSLSVLSRNDENPTRFGIVVPNKVFSRAVDRSRVKRVLSESTRYELSSLKPGFDCVFLPKQSILRAYTADVMKEVKSAFSKVKIVK